MRNDSIVSNIRKELAYYGNEENRLSEKRFFKEEIKTYGLKKPAIDKIAKTAFREIESPKREKVFALCEQLWQSGYMEEALIACRWSYFIRKQFLPDDFHIFENWIHRYVSNWATCDTFCNHTVGAFLTMYPEKTEGLSHWAKSENRWLRRAAAVSLIVPARKGKFLNDVLAIASILLQDKDDMVRKGYGWMLKVASQQHPEEVFEFVIQRKNIMPRTALRYAIEKMAPEKKEAAMAK
ncbi:MAG: DNA alkylation repair protein [Marinilabiliaceae bacterium]